MFGSINDKKNMKLFSLNSNHAIAEKIAKAAGVPLGKLSSRQFSDEKSKSTSKKAYVALMFSSFNLQVFQ